MTSPTVHRSRLGADLLSAGLVAAGASEGGVISEASPALVALFRDAGLLGRRLSDLAEGADRALLDSTSSAPAGSTPRPVGFRALRPDGTTFYAELRASAPLGDTGRVVFVITDDSERFSREEELRSLAFQDSLTGLPNRLLFQDRASQALQSSARDGGTLSCLMIADLDGFKQINDRHGHAAGDEILRQVAARLTATVRGSDTVARLGGDEFAFVLPGLPRREDAVVAGARTLKAIARPFVIDGVTHSVGMSVGVALSPSDGTTVDGLFEAADSAMYLAKRRAGNQLVMVDEVTLTSSHGGLFEKDAPHLLGVEEMDREHLELFAWVEQTTARPKEGGAGWLSSRIATLRAMTRRHFASEEALLEAAGFAGLASHAREHQRLLGDIDLLAEHAEFLSPTLLRHLLLDWLLSHIRTYDRAAARAVARADSRPTDGHRCRSGRAPEPSSES